jgi:uncharacterized repeat protein (TIGR03803 family)
MILFRLWSMIASLARNRAALLLLFTLAIVCSFASLGSSAPAGGGTTEFTPSNAARESVLYTFRGSPDGSYPVGALVADDVGALYGTTYTGGYTGSSACSGLGCGTVFKLTPSASGYTESTLYSFRGGPDGSNPNGGLIVDKTGAVYGTTVWGGISGSGSGTGYGVVFKLTPSGTGYAQSVIHVFQSGTDGANPHAGLMLDEAGALYGTTSSGGVSGCSCGSAFELTPSGTRYLETILHRFGGAGDGYDPEAGLVADKAGALYGTTVWGGVGAYGTVFKLTPSRTGYSESVLYNFSNLRRGANPRAGLIVDRMGALYGTTTHGGAYGERGSNYGEGTVFRLTPSPKGYEEHVLHNFSRRKDGEDPEAGLIADKTGALYGTTCCFGGERAYGTVFKLTPSARDKYSESILFHFTGPKTGEGPYGGLIVDKEGALYGTTSGGGGGCGNSGCGTIFKLAP